MSWIDEVPEDDATGDLAEVYERIGTSRGKVSNIMRVQSLEPRAMSAHLDLYLSVVFGRGGLSRPERELLAVVVSAENDCEYCVLHHSAALEAHWDDPGRVARIREAPLEAELSGRERALVRYALALTRNPAEVSEAHVRDLRDAGLGDREVLQANLVVSYFNFVNRVAEGLGVESTPEERQGYRY